MKAASLWWSKARSISKWAQISISAVCFFFTVLLVTKRKKEKEILPCNPRTKKTEAGRFWDWASLGYIASSRPTRGTKTNKQNNKPASKSINQSTNQSRTEDGQLAQWLRRHCPCKWTKPGSQHWHCEAPKLPLTSFTGVCGHPHSHTQMYTSTQAYTHIYIIWNNF